MNRRAAYYAGLLCLAMCAAGASAYQISPPASTQPAAAVSLKDLEQAVQSLQGECTAQAGSPDVAPPRETVTPEPEPAWQQPPISMQCRVITTVVHFSRLRVACDEGPDLWYTVGFFQDPTDQKTYRFRFNDMGAAAGNNEQPSLYVVVFRPAEGELTESEIAALIPASWVKEQSQQK